MNIPDDHLGPRDGRELADGAVLEGPFYLLRARNGATQWFDMKALQYLSDEGLTYCIQNLMTRGLPDL